MNERPRTRMNGRESAVGTGWAYQAGTAAVNQNRQKLRFKKKDLWTICQMLWKTRRMPSRETDSSPAEMHAPLPRSVRGAGEAGEGALVRRARARE